ncbi:type II toxin-antitoxin system VapC family toxin [Herbidospora sp. RD11066]
MDTGPLVAAFNRDDRHHKVCADLVERYPGPLLVPPTVIVEVCQLVEKELGSRSEADFLASFPDALIMVDLVDDDLRRMSALVNQYASLRLGAADASVIAVAERLNIPTVATLDRRHFTVVRPCHVDSLVLLPFEL